MAKLNKKEREIIFEAPHVPHSPETVSEYNAFIRGARWADANPPPEFLNLIESIDKLKELNGLPIYNEGFFHRKNFLKLNKVINEALAALEAWSKTENYESEEGE